MPHTSFIDLCSDDESDPKGAAAARPSSQLPSTSAKKQIDPSTLRKANPSHKQKPHPRRADVIDITKSPKSKGASHIKHSTGSSSQPSRKPHPPSFVPASSGRPREGGKKSSNTSKTSSQPMPKWSTELINLDSDEEDQPRTGKNGFVRPRGLSPQGGTKKAGVNIVDDSNTPNRLKRQLERDNAPGGDGSVKKLKLSQRENNEVSPLKKSSNNSHDTGIVGSSITSERGTAAAPKDGLSGLSGNARSTSSSPARRRNALTDVEAKSSAPSHSTSGGKSSGHGTSRIDSTNLSLHKNRSEETLRGEQGRKGRQKPSSSPSRSSLARFSAGTQNQGKAQTKSRETTRKDTTPSVNSTAKTSLREEIVQDERTAKSKTRATDVARTNKSPPASPMADLSVEVETRDSQALERRKSPKHAPDRVDNVSSSTLEIRDGHVQPASASAISSESTSPSKRKPSSEEDQGYASLSSSNGDDLRKKTDQATSAGVAEPDEPIRSIENATAAATTVVAVVQNEQSSATAVRTRHQAYEHLPAHQRMTEADEADLQLRSEASSAMHGSTMNDVLMQDSESTFTQPTARASTLKRASLWSGLSLTNRVEKTLGSYLEEALVDNEYWTSVSLRRARLTKEDAHSTGNLDCVEQDGEELTSFASFNPLPLLPIKKGSPAAKSHAVWTTQRTAADGKPLVPLDFLATSTPFTTHVQDVPPYAHYVSIENNLLAPNVIHLHCWPYFGDDFDMSDASNLHGQYKIDITDRERKLLLLIQAQKYERYVESALQDLDCSWADVLRFLLELNPDVGTDLDARKALQNRQMYCQQDFSRASDRWVAVLNSLSPSTPDKLARAAVLCENFQKMAKFSLWHVARRSELTITPDETSHLATAPSADDNELTCRICLRFDCPYHGQFKHHPDDSGTESDSESIFSVDTAVGTDVVHPLKANHRSRIAFPSQATHTTIEAHSHHPDPMLRKKQRDPNYWNNYKNKAEDRGPFYPCSHPGMSCTDAKCSCFVKQIPCEKTCSCAHDCPRKFKGCACGLKKGHQLVCYENAECVCWHVGRECDPDLCGSCGVCDVVDPINKHNEAILVGRCRNASIQRGVPKHTLLGDSGVHGLGLYACEDIRHNHFVGEYKGEIITKKEADRRGAVYEHQKLSYLFSLNKSQEIDSTYFGNKVRFINHAHGDKANIYPRIIMVNTVHRIALYAAKDIPAGKELLFDYGPFFPDEQLQGKKSKKTAPESKKSAPHVRNANLVKEFYDVAESEDEDGVLRAKAVSSKGRQKGKKPLRGTGSRAGGKKAESAVVAAAAVTDLARPSLKRARSASEDAQPGMNGEYDVERRLASYNISDDLPSSDAMDGDVDDAAAAGLEDDDDAFEPDEEESGAESEESENSGRSEFGEQDEDEEMADDDEEEEEVERRRITRGAVDLRGSVRR